MSCFQTTVLCVPPLRTGKLAGYSVLAGGPEKVKPKVLVATTYQWYPTARMAMALVKAGFTVEAVCPSRHPMFKTSAVQKRYRFHGLLPLTSLSEAIEKAKPDLIVSGDDLATKYLHSLHAQELRKGETGASICALIERSLGSPESFPIAYSRTAFMKLAREEGIRIPETAAISTTEGLREWIGQFGLPAVLKADGTNGGEGVRIVRTPQEAHQEFRHLHAPPLLARAAKRTLLDQDAGLLRPAILRQRSGISAQTFIAGTEATSAVACWNGEVIASLHFEVVNKKSAAGYSTVVRRIEGAEMMAAAEKIARRLNLSGLYGFDFMLEATAHDAYLIEMNPRSTQVGHLALGPGRDIPAAIFSAVAGRPVQVSPSVTEKDTIALFPQEWLRDSGSPYLRSAYHDVPWEEPELIRACIRSRKKLQPWRVERGPMRALRAAGAPRI
jgi:carbamoylphosphate synthase large subunit